MDKDPILERLEALEHRVGSLLARPVVKFKKLHPDAKIPQYQTEGAAGMDLVACNDALITIWPGGVALIPLGFAVELPGGWEMQIRPRSGLALNHTVTVLNSPGTVDSDYRAECKAIVINHGRMALTVDKGDRIAQAVVAKAAQAIMVEVKELSQTTRGQGGFGSTGGAPKTP
jgi:dUTP pyrophosphatase